ncbi:MAG: ComEC/Rec2 family competence protein [Lachnospiraceae bacterium]|nr:ComEC/Rec2 family competence protein [Ruminococcus sp.]MCM1274470.1 ComEC/Rec2 family competence protein [Lachnospiraceae bacterium]
MKPDNSKRALLNLPFVKFAPFMAVGMLTRYFGGGLLCGILFAAAAVFAVCSAAKRSRAAICAVGLLWGVAVMSAYLALYCEPIKEFAGKTVQAELVVNKSSSMFGGTREYTVEMNLAGRKALVVINDGEKLETGDMVNAVVELHETDSDDMLQNLADGVLLSGEITELISVKSGSAGVYSAIRALRGRMLEMLNGNIFGSAGELAPAMLLGESSALSPELREKLKICGASHYTAVSGSHFALFAAVLMGMLPEKRRRAKQALSLLFAPAAVIFFGPTPSVLRASVMFLLYSLAPIFYRKADTLNSLCIAAALICTFSPATILDTGFGMSVLGVLGAGVVGTEISKKLRMLLPDKAKPLSPAVTVLSVSVCAVVCTSPISVFAFKGVSLMGAFSSVLLMPLMTVSVIFMVPLGVTGLSLFALPVDLAMRAAAAVVRFLGSFRGLWLTLDFKYAWALSLCCVLALLAAAFGSMKAFSFSGKLFAVFSAAAMLVSLAVCERRSEVRFVGNYSTSAAVIIEGKEAVVFISGSGAGLATGISRTMREHGAVGITCIAAFDADHSGALAIRELSEMTKIGAVYSNSLVKTLLGGSDVQVVPESSRLSVSGVTFAAAKPSDKETSADIVLYNGRLTKSPESPARYAVYFSSSEKALPENWHNARRNGDFYIKLENGAKNISVVQ